jgi:UDP-galactopyranose mutase
MPLRGYTHMFQRMLDNPLITVRTGVEMTEVPEQLYRNVIYSGPIDAFFGYRFGPLPYRSLEFRFETLDVDQFQPVGTVNEPEESVPYTRTTEFKHLTGQRRPRTTIVREFPCADGDPYYPIPRPENAARYARYEALANATEDVYFVGRLATYKYYNMDQCVGQALATFAKLGGRVSRAA